MTTILFQGDSITDAGRNLNCGCSNSIGQGYAVMVAGELGVKDPEKYRIINKGISGNRIVDLYARMKSDIWNESPNIVSILVGVNDVIHEVLYKNGVDAKRFQRIYEMLIEDTIDVLPDVKFILLEPFVTHGSLSTHCWNEIRDGVMRRGNIVYNISQKYNLGFVPLRDKFEELCTAYTPEVWMSDGVHPTIAGHGIIKQEWLKVYYRDIDKMA